MFKYLFQSMNEKLDGILAALPASHGIKQQEALERQLRELRDMSDGIIEEWLQFEEKLGKASFRQPTHEAPSPDVPGCAAEAEEADDSPVHSLQYQRGEGYFKLYMFDEAAREFHAVVNVYPEFLKARLYLALCFLQNENVSEASSHLRTLISLTDDGKLKAVAYNALGCVKAVEGNVEKACECFRASHALDPSFEDPVYNLKACQIQGGVLQLGVAIG